MYSFNTNKTLEVLKPGSGGSRQQKVQKSLVIRDAVEGKKTRL